jgi:hypothetical protein
MAQSVTRALQTIERYHVTPDQIDRAILAAINVTLCVVSCCDDRVSEGFNRDLAQNGKNSSRTFSRREVELIPA